MGDDDQLAMEQVEVLVGAADAARPALGRNRWRCEVNGHVVDLLADAARVLPPDQPAGRELRFAAGAAVFNLRCAAARLGFDSWYGLAPYADEPELLARVVLEPAVAADRRLADLYDQIAGRYAVRAGTRSPGVPAETRIDLIRAAGAECADLAWLPARGTQRALDLVVAAEYRTAAGCVVVRPASRFGRRPALAVLSVGGDQATDQLTAGMAAQRVLLTAIRHGFTYTSIEAPIRYDDLRAEVQAVTGRPGHPIALLRFVPVVAQPHHRWQMVADHRVIRPPVERTSR